MLVKKSKCRKGWQKNTIKKTEKETKKETQIESLNDSDLEGLLEVGGGYDAVLVVVDDAERLLELLDLLLAEQGEDVRARLLGLLGSFRRLRMYR